MKRHNKELEQTGSAVSNGMGGPCSSIQCSAGLLLDEQT